MKHKKLITILLGIVLTAVLLSFIPNLSYQTGALTAFDKYENHGVKFNIRFYSMNEQEQNDCIALLNKIPPEIFSGLKMMQVFPASQAEAGRYYTDVMRLRGCTAHAIIHEGAHHKLFLDGYRGQDVYDHTPIYHTAEKEVAQIVYDALGGVQI